jgi:hypothetical protein
MDTKNISLMDIGTSALPIGFQIDLRKAVTSASKPPCKPPLAYGSFTILQQSNPTPSKKSDDEEEIDKVKPRELEFSSSMLLYVHF